MTSQAPQTAEQNLVSEVNEMFQSLTESKSVHFSEVEFSTLHRIRDRLQHVVTTGQSDLRRVITGDENTRIRDHARSVRTKVKGKVTRKVRQVVTGDGDKLLRDWVKESKVTRTVDKFAFMLGIFILCATEYMWTSQHELFNTYYCGVITVMIALRYWMYKRQGFLYFLMDFCYFANTSVILTILVFPESQLMWRINYVISNGTLLFAVLVWRNSLVFHSLDKVTSISVHMLPALACYLERWSDHGRMCDASGAACTMTWTESVLFPVLFYVVWQALYIVKTEIVDGPKLKEDKTIHTSLRWLSRDEKNGMNKLVSGICKKTGVMAPDEKFDPELTKTKLVFWMTQFIFTLFTFIPPNLFLNAYLANTGYVLLVFSATAWNGANYYFEVFARRYHSEQSKKQAEIDAAARSRAGTSGSESLTGEDEPVSERGTKKDQ